MKILLIFLLSALSFISLSQSRIKHKEITVDTIKPLNNKTLYIADTVYVDVLKTKSIQVETQNQLVLQFYKDATKGFWVFCGYVLLTSLFITGIVITITFTWNRFWRHWSIIKHGYPPTNCDADGDCF